ncbi:MAG: hypothetical protein ABL971_09330 [Vicinamibacterales bacterium]
MRVTAVELIGAAIGTLVCGLPYLFYGATFPPIAITSVALGVAAAGLTLLRPSVRWQAGAGVGIGLLVVLVVQIIADGIRDPTSHNLLPFEVLIAFAIGFPPAILGVLLGKAVRRHVPSPEVGGIALVTLALAVAAVSARGTLSEVTRMETLASKKVGVLIAAQREFHAAHPLRGYTCNLGELGEPFSGPIEKNHPSESYHLNGVAYHGGTAAIEDGYRYSLKCVATLPAWKDKPDPQESFVLTVRSLVERGDTRPLKIFCAGADGAIRSIRTGRLYSCFAEGRIVQNVN